MRIVLATLGSFGDLHPVLALAEALAARGHDAVVATSPAYAGIVRGAGVGFAPMRPDLPTDEALMRAIMRASDGLDALVRRLLMPAIEASYDDLLAAARGADLLIGHPITFAAPSVAEALGLPWASVALAPATYISAQDPPAGWNPLTNAVLRATRPLGPRLAYAAFRRATRAWWAPLDALRARRGLPPLAGHPLFAAQHAPRLSLGLFSRALGEPRGDWPTQARVTGFLFRDAPRDTALPAALARFVDGGDPPLVFTLGTSAVHVADAFYREAAAAARALGRRAVLLVGAGRADAYRDLVDARVHVAEYAPFAALLPRACATVHQGGIGTLAQALRAGRPMVVVPFAYDQFDNAARARRLGVAAVVRRGGFTARRGARLLDRLLADAAVAERARAVAAAIRAEDGAAAACAAIASAFAPAGAAA